MDLDDPDSNPSLKPKHNKRQRKTAVKEVEGIVVGRDKKIIPPEEVYKLAQIGCKNHEIAAWFEIDDSTLNYQFKQELIKGRESLKQSLRRAMLANAMKGNAAIQIFLAKNLLGMSDNPLDSEENKPLPWSE